MGYTASELVAIAKAELGYLEKKSNSKLDSKTANAGYNNYTKYARDLHQAGYYQASKQGLAWCDMFVDHCHWIAAGKDAKEAQRVICQTGPYGAGCGYSAQYYKDAGRFHKTPKVGDQIFFWNSAKTKVAHTGIVKAIDKTYVYTIEGNTSSASGVEANGGGVFEKKYKLNYARIYGYGRPRYDEETTEEEPKPVEEKEEVCSVNIKVLKKGAKGDEVKALQILLIGYGYSCGSSGVDGSFGPATDKALRAYQKAKGLTVDGACGPKTWNKLLGLS